jgi:drug/metabolite transporter (DMT)-like permease
MLGAVFALLSALSFSLQNIMARRGVAQASPLAGAFITILLGVPIFAIGALITGQLLRMDILSLEDYMLLAAAGVVHFVVGRNFNYRAVAAIGAARVGPVQALTTPYSILIAVIFLGESISPVMGIGIVLILLAPAIMIERRARQPVAARVHTAAISGSAEARFELRQMQGYVSAGMSAMAYGSSPVFIRAALENQSGLSVLGGLVSYTAAAALMLAGLALPGRRELLTSMRPSTVRLFLGAGFFVAMAQMFRFVALSLAPVSVVTTLTRSGSIFTLGLSWIVNRHLELITPRTVAGAVVSVSGAVLLVLASG